MPVVISFNNVLKNLFLQKQFATSFVLFSPWITLLLILNIVFKNTAQLWGTRMAHRMLILDSLLRAPYQRYLWLRFIHDIFMIWTEGLQNLELFVDYLNNSVHSTIKFTCSHSYHNTPFLDIMVPVKNGFTETDLYTKPTDKHQYLCSHFILSSSSH